MSTAKVVVITLSSIAAALAGWLMLDKYVIKPKQNRFSDKQTAVNYMYLVRGINITVLSGMDDGYVIAWANAVHDGQMSFTFNGKSYNTATGYAN